MYTNNTGVSLSMAVWLAHDEYDHNSDPNHISATGLLRSTKQIALAKRVPQDSAPEDVSSLVASRIGTAIHNSIESVWTHHREAALAKLGYPKRVAELVRINPSKADLDADEDIIPVYMELRSSKKVGKYTVSGKFDFLAEGMLEDFKSTSTFTYTNKTSDDKYVMQGSIYRWLNQDIATEDVMAIQYLFKDWSAAMAKANPKYPPARILTQKFTLKPVSEIESFVTNKLAAIELASRQEQHEMVPCNAEELWRKAPAYKYYKNPEKTTRSTKNFDTLAEANIRLGDDNFVGLVKTVPGKVVACRYCPAFSICKQKDDYIATGELVL